MTFNPPGASAAEWAHWTLVLGMTEDLLPIVSRRDAPIAAYSKLKTVGKVPSRYNASREVVGIAHWTAIHSTEGQVSTWEKENDYGICLQTRHVRAIDIDVDDLVRASAIRAKLCRLLGVSPPARGRPGSPRVVLAVRCEGAGLDKRVVRLDGGGAVELLADGQQFVVAGAHPSGGRYFWEAGLPGDFPIVSESALRDALFAVAREFGAPGELRVDVDAAGWWTNPRAGHSPRDALAGTDQRTAGGDPVVGWLDARGWSRGIGRGGETLVWCPWLDDHTGDSGETETAWFPAGTGGYLAGHFKCLHAHCARRTDEDFLDAVGWKFSVECELQDITGDDDDRFEPGRRTGVRRARAAPGGLVAGRVLPRASVPDAVDVDAHGGRAGDRTPGLGLAGLPLALAQPLGEIPDDPTAAWTSATPGRSLTRSRKGFIATMHNLTRALATPGFWQRIAYDRFRDEVMRCDWQGANAGRWVSWTDEDYTDARIVLEIAGFEPPGKDAVRDAVWKVAMASVFDSAQTWLVERPAWDGVKRVETFFARYCGADDTPYTRAVGAYLWSALAGRVLQPGVKADMVPVLHGAGGLRKTTLVQILAPAREFAGRVRLNAEDAEIARLLRGKLVVEFPELRGLRGRDSESIKDFLSMDADEWTPKYKEIAAKHPRRFVFVGTTDKAHFLADTAGNLRRWLPVTVRGVGGLLDAEGHEENSPLIDLQGVTTVRDQLWAEGAAMFAGTAGDARAGVRWQRAQKLASAEFEAYALDDTDEDELLAWINAPADDGAEVTGGGDSPTDITLGEVDGASVAGPAKASRVAFGLTRGDVGFTLLAILVGCLGCVPASAKRHETRVSEALSRFGLVRTRGKASDGTRNKRVWKWPDLV